MYLDHFPRAQLRCVVFDDLQHDAQHFASSVFKAVGLAPMQLPARLQQHVLPAGRSRSVLLTRTVKWAADLARAGGMPKLVGRVKTSGLVQRLLYRPYNERKRPTPMPQTVTRLREMFLPDIARLDEKLGTTFGHLWSYG